MKIKTINFYAVENIFIKPARKGKWWVKIIFDVPTNSKAFSPISIY